MSFYWVVPITDIHSALGAVPQVYGYETEVGREDDVGYVLLFVAKVIFIPFQDFNPVGRFVAHFDHAALEVLGPIGKVDEFLPANP